MPASWLTKRRKMALTPEEKSHNEMMKELLGLQKGFDAAYRRSKKMKMVRLKKAGKTFKKEEKKRKKKYWEKEDYSNALQYPRQQWPPY